LYEREVDFYLSRGCRFVSIRDYCLEMELIKIRWQRTEDGGRLLKMKTEDDESDDRGRRTEDGFGEKEKEYTEGEAISWVRRYPAFVT
jgi:hypothetical protein